MRDGASRWPGWAGIAAPLVYLVAVVHGGLVTPGYDHLSLPISALMAGGAGSAALIALFAAYNILLGVFAVWVVLGAGGGQFAAAGWTLLLCAAVGLLLLWAPMDPMGAPPTFAGGAHLALAGAASLASMAAVVAGAIGWGRAGYRARALASWICFGIILATGGLAAAGAAGEWRIAGLLERLTIGTFLAWVLWSAAVMPAPDRSRHRF